MLLEWRVAARCPVLSTETRCYVTIRCQTDLLCLYYSTKRNTPPNSGVFRGGGDGATAPPRSDRKFLVAVRVFCLLKSAAKCTQTCHYRDKKNFLGRGSPLCHIPLPLTLMAPRPLPHYWNPKYATASKPFNLHHHQQTLTTHWTHYYRRSMIKPNYNRFTSVQVAQVNHRAHSKRSKVKVRRLTCDIGYLSNALHYGSHINWWVC